jgi:threonine/homoserine/homoserine lactone efflux protein
MTLSLYDAVALFGVMLVLAALPSSSVLLVITRSTASGLKHGVLATLGIVTGDIIFILIAVLGLSLLAELSGELFQLVKYLGAAYLCWLGLVIWRSTNAVASSENNEHGSLLSSYSSGLLFTLADQKAILFYLGLFPAFIDLADITGQDIAAIIFITLIAVGGVKVVYAVLAERAAAMLSSDSQLVLKKIAAGLMVLIAVSIVASAN